LPIFDTIRFFSIVFRRWAIPVEERLRDQHVYESRPARLACWNHPFLTDAGHGGCGNSAARCKTSDERAGNNQRSRYAIHGLFPRVPPEKAGMVFRVCSRGPGIDADAANVLGGSQILRMC
jgi:hypothetical protein